MTQLVTRDTEAGAPDGVLTVADLVSRFGPGAAVSETGPPVSVPGLLRREAQPDDTEPQDPVPAGAAHDASEVTDNLYEDDGVYEYEGAYEFEDDQPRERRRISGVVGRRSAVAAGVLIAAGSVVGATIASTGSEPLSDDEPLAETPSREWLDQQPAGAAPVTTPPAADPSAPGGPLDPGEPVDQSWMNSAFPGTADSDDPDPVDLGSAPSRSSSRNATEQTVRIPPVTGARPAPAETDDDARADEDRDEPAPVAPREPDRGSSDQTPQTPTPGEGDRPSPDRPNAPVTGDPDADLGSDVDAPAGVTAPQSSGAAQPFRDPLAIGDIPELGDDASVTSLATTVGTLL